MISSHLEGVEFVVANTDAQALAQSLSERRIQLGVSITQGLGAGSQPDVGRAAAEEAIDEILENLEPGIYMSNHHLLIDAPDSHVLLHTEVVNQMPAGVGTHRIAECATLTSPRIREIVDRRGIELLSYRDI